MATTITIMKMQLLSACSNYSEIEIVLIMKVINKQSKSKRCSRVVGVVSDSHNNNNNTNNNTNTNTLTLVSSKWLLC
jgi:hypothetical protein